MGVSPFVHMLSLHAAAASFAPSADEVITLQYFPAPVVVSSVQVAPLSSEVHMLGYATAASFVPSTDEVIANQAFVSPIEVSSIHV